MSSSRKGVRLFFRGSEMSLSHKADRLFSIGGETSSSRQAVRLFPEVVRCPHLAKPLGFSFFSCYIDKEYKS